MIGQGLPPVPIHLHARPTTPFSSYFSRTTPKSQSSSDAGSELLQAIRNAFRGTKTGEESPVTSLVYTAATPTVEDEELSWDTYTVVLGSAGVVRKKWCFKEEGQSVQWACIGWFEQPEALAANSPRSGHYSVETPDDQQGSAPDPNQRPTFGPFSRLARDSKHAKEPASRARAVFVFLRSIGRIFFLNGLEYTFYLPFLVRQAWALSPHGIMLQRVLEPGELEEAVASGDEPLPTLFTMVNPFAEASTVGVTEAIRDGIPTSLHEKDPEKIVESIPAAEHVLWVSNPSRDPMNHVIVTVNVSMKSISVWRYAYVNPKDIPPPIPRAAPRTTTAHRKSMSGPMSPPPRPPMFTAAAPPQPIFASLPNAPPSLTGTTTMAALVPGSIPDGPPPNAAGRRTSLGMFDHLVNVDKATVGGRVDSTPHVDPVDHARMRPTYWMEKVFSEVIPEADAQAYTSISVGLFDRRWDGDHERVRLALSLPQSQTSLILVLTVGKHAITAAPTAQLKALSVASMRATRPEIDDLLILKPDHTLSLLTHGMYELPLRIQGIQPSPIISLQNGADSSVTLCRQDGGKTRVSIEMRPRGMLTAQCLSTLSMALAPTEFYDVHYRFLVNWSEKAFDPTDKVSFDALCSSLYQFLRLDWLPDGALPPTVVSQPFHALQFSSSASRFVDDPALAKLLDVPQPPLPTDPHVPDRKPHTSHANVLNALHLVAQEFLLLSHKHEALMMLVPVICKLALVVRPEWADYWKRLVPDALGPWPSPAKSVIAYLDDRLPVTPFDVFATLYSRINNPQWDLPDTETWKLLLAPGENPSYAFGDVDPLCLTHQMLAMYHCLAEGHPQTRVRAEQAMQLMVRARQLGSEFNLDRQPLGPAAPLKEALRTCQTSPSGDWSVAAYSLVGRNELAEVIDSKAQPLESGGYRTLKDFILPTFPRRAINEHAEDIRKALAGELATVSGVELELEDFTRIRFGQDRRLEEVARLLCSSTVAVIRTIERPELNELDQAKEHQLQVLRVAERTLALPPGRALFTFGSVHVVTREAYAIPKIEYGIRIYPQNVLVNPETGKIPLECAAWGDFHNGVAAGLRIAPTATGVQSSWIKFNKPNDLTPEHAGFLYALGLTGHLREMLTWHTFSYLTPKHDLTSIAVLLGLSAANAGTSNKHVTKLLAVHTPALLPTPDVDLNVPLITQAAGLSGIGLLYMGTKNRRMAEVCLSQISRKELIQPDLSNEYREAYTFSAALAFGMVMLGKGTSIPADLVLLARLRVLIQGEGHTQVGLKHPRPAFDVNLTSPAATMALGLMYLRTERQDVADILVIPDTVLALDRIQPSFLMLRTIAKALIMFGRIAPTAQWMAEQIPPPIAQAMEARKAGKPIHESYELAFYNIVAGCCFAIGLKYAGTAREEAYLMLIRHHDMFSQLAYTNTAAIEHRIKRAAIRDGLNMIAIALNMVMAGTGEINCLRRLRFSFALHNLNFKYGTHVMVHMSLGLLFLGGGKYTLGTSDASIACLVAAFFPRFNQVSSDNKTYLQALRHLWVLAVEPRCLITRDVDTKEVVYLPVKIKVKDGNETGTTQLIAPTLFPEIDKIMSVRVDTPRYWPFYLDIANTPQHKDSLLRSQTLYVKRRTAFLSYTEDPKGSRSLYVRSGSSAGDAAVLDFPRLRNTDQHPATDLHEFISSYSNDTFFLAFADWFCRDQGSTQQEQLFFAYCHATLLDGILQDKSRTIQTHLTLFRYRTMSVHSPYFGLGQYDLRFAAEFYSKIFGRWFSGAAENNARPPLVREYTLRAALLELDEKLEALRNRQSFLPMLREYARGAGVPTFERGSALASVSRALATYLQRHSVPVSTLLVVLKALAVSSHARCIRSPPPDGAEEGQVLDEAIKHVLHATGIQLTTAVGNGWSMSSLEEILASWDTEDAMEE